MSVHQLKDGRWFVQYRDNSKPSGYTREYFGRGLDAEREARDRNNALGLNPYESRTPPEQTPLFVDMANAYLAGKIAENERNTIKVLMYKLNRNILPAIGELRITDITPGRIDKYVRARILDGVKRSTINRELTDIISILNWAVERRHIKYNPLHKYRKPKIDDEIIFPPTSAEIRAIWTHAKPHLKRAMLISYYTGTRPGGELFSLKWRNVDWINKTINITSAKKNGPGGRIVPLHIELITALESWYEEDQKRQDGTIVHYRGQPVASLRKTFTSAKHAAGITRKLPLYAFRHAFATNMLAMGGDLKSTSEMLGHASPKITMQVYQHTDAALHRKNIDKLPGICFEDLGN